ncbi:hypothetical protein SLS64_008196 [Diaporthe eres]|uniref:Uncharacterized protein n=1 Tax=Diaporthe eres TaxID=83184 RepID=A0ABR1PK13_DIAER
MAASSGANVQQNPVAPQQGSNRAERLNIWLEDLESIRRERPVVSPTLFMAQRVEVAAPPATGQGAARSAGPEVIVVDDDEEDGPGGQAGSAAALRMFYGQWGDQPDEADEMMRYQDLRLGRENKYPSRRNGLGFDMAGLRRDKAWADPIRTLQDVQPSWDHGMFMTSPPLGFDEAVSRNWTQDSSPTSLLFGFPMLGNVVLYRAMNYGGARSACFFKALAYLVYGDQSLYQRMQAEHQQHFSDVLEWEDHPRHQLYTVMNQKFYCTTISTDNTSSSLDGEVQTIANFFQLLSIPQAWMPLDMLDVTADLYNLFIVVYTVNESSTQTHPLITEVSVKGSYNARHVFLLFNGFHYQPMVPNEFLASEFTFPRVTYENVKGLPWSRDTDQGKSSVDLRWRTTWGAYLDKRKGALPVDHVFYRESLRIAMTGNCSQQ